MIYKDSYEKCRAAFTTAEKLAVAAHEAAVKAGEDYKHYFGYKYTVESDGGRWKLTANLNGQNLMG